MGQKENAARPLYVTVPPKRLPTQSHQILQQTPQPSRTERSFTLGCSQISPCPLCLLVSAWDTDTPCVAVYGISVDPVLGSDPTTDLTNRHPGPIVFGQAFSWTGSSRFCLWRPLAAF